MKYLTSAVVAMSGCAAASAIFCFGRDVPALIAATAIAATAIVAAVDIANRDIKE